MPGFEPVYRLSGAGFTIKNLLGSGTISLTKGDLVTLASGEISLGTSGSTAFIGVCLETAENQVSHRFPVIVDEDVVYSVTDASVRKIGDTLDLSGTVTGTHSVTTSSDKEFVVVEDSSADEPTKVRFNVGKHVFNKAQ